MKLSCFVESNTLMMFILLFFVVVAGDNKT